MEEKARFKKTRWFLITTAIIIVLIILIYPLITSSYHNFSDRERANRSLCCNRLQHIGLAMLIYADDHNNTYPDANMWCDILLDEKDISINQLRCPNVELRSCSYAMNPNCEPNLPGDIVLLFESTPGWNQIGGPELLNPDNHLIKGCNICFDDGHVEFVEPKDFNSLKWK